MVVGGGVGVYGLKAKNFVPRHAAFGPFGDHLSGHGSPESQASGVKGGKFADLARVWTLVHFLWREGLRQSCSDPIMPVSLAFQLG